MAYRGIDIREAGGLIFRELLEDSAGNPVTAAGATLMLTKWHTDGTLLTYDWNDKSFKSGECTSPTVTPTVRKANNNTVDTGIWSYLMSDVTGLTAGDIITQHFYHASALPTTKRREMQYASGVLADLSLVLGSDPTPTGGAARLAAAWKAWADVETPVAT